MSANQCVSSPKGSEHVTTHLALRSASQPISEQHQQHPPGDVPGSCTLLNILPAPATFGAPSSRDTMKNVCLHCSLRSFFCKQLHRQKKKHTQKKTNLPCLRRAKCKAPKWRVVQRLFHKKWNKNKRKEKEMKTRFRHRMVSGLRPRGYF